MAFAHLFLIWVSVLVSLTLLDAGWHLLLFRWEYRSLLQPLMRTRAGRPVCLAAPALVVHVLRLTALVMIVLAAVPGHNLTAGALYGAVAGLLGVGLSGVANFAWLRAWRVELMILEAAWGPIMGGCAGVLVVLLR
jgi:uncharacterized membrane protein